MLEFQDCIFGQGGFSLTVNWSLPQGAHLAVIGPSGAGKSTLLAGIAGFADQTSGQMKYDGHPLAARPDERPVAMLFQDHNLFPHLTVTQNVALGIRPNLSVNPKDAARVNTALSEVGLDGLGDRKPAALSGGQQSRVALARVLVMARPIILLDEPFSALGPAQRVDMLDSVKHVANQLNATLIMVTHDPGEARALGGLVSFVSPGAAHAPIPADAFFANPPQGMRDYTGV